MACRPTRTQPRAALRGARPVVLRGIRGVLADAGDCRISARAGRSTRCSSLSGASASVDPRKSSLSCVRRESQTLRSARTHPRPGDPRVRGGSTGVVRVAHSRFSGTSPRFRGLFLPLPATYRSRRITLDGTSSQCDVRVSSFQNCCFGVGRYDGYPFAVLPASDSGAPPDGFGVAAPFSPELGQRSSHRLGQCRCRFRRFAAHEQDWVVSRQCD